MELFATLLCMFSLFGGIYFIVALVFRKIRKKPKNKVYSCGLLVSVLVFIISVILFGVFQTPESREKYEQQRIEQQKEKEAKEQTEKEKAAKEQAEKEKAAKEQAEKEKEAKEQAEKEKAEKAKAEKEKAEKAKAEKEKAEKKQAKKETDSNSNKKGDTQDMSPEESMKKAIIKVVGEENLETFNYVPDNNFALIKFKGSENLSSKMKVKGMYMDISNILKGIQKDISVNVDINVTYPLQDKYGNIREDIVIKTTFNNDTIKKINFDNFDYNDIPSVADEWWNHNALNITD